MVSKFDWIIHYVANGVVCGCCGEREDGFIPYACNAHTHGMEKFGHPDFQVVINYPIDTVSYILNAFGQRVRDGARFHDGEYISGIFEDCPVRLNEFEEAGRTVLRVTIPDKNGNFPECEGCDLRYQVQLLKTDELYKRRQS